MPQSTFPLTVAKQLPTPDSRRRFKRQCLKQKNILQQTSQIQIGCKIQKLYDFYTSKNYIQINLFIGNKTKQVIKNYEIGFRGTQNLQVHLQEKQQRIVKQNTQAKQRIIIEWLDQQQEEYSHEIFLTFSFTSPLLTLKDTPIPISVWSFCHFPPQPVIKLQTNYQQLLNRIKQTYQLIEQQQIQVNQTLFKKGQLMKQMQKYFDRLIEIQNSQQNDNTCGIYAGLFTMKSLVEEHFIIFQIQQRSLSPKLKIILAGNQYKYFEAIFSGLKFLLQK